MRSEIKEGIGRLELEGRESKGRGRGVRGKERSEMRERVVSNKGDREGVQRKKRGKSEREG